MNKMFDLPKDIEEEVLCRIPLTSLRHVRSTCKKWNALSKDRSFAEKHLARQAAAKVVMMTDYSVYLMGVGESGIIKREAKLSGSDQIDVCQVFHCDGLLLCISKDNTKLVVWNPYLGQTRWIVPTPNYNILERYSYALGYDKSSNSHKILRYIQFLSPAFDDLKIYDFNSDSWRPLDVTPDWDIDFNHRGVSLKGNTYWYATETREFKKSFLVCFDFTRETLWSPLPLPFEPTFEDEDTVSLSVARGEQLVVLFQPWDRDTLNLEIWISTKIEPNSVSWNTKVFLSVSWKQIIHPRFFIDQEKQVAILFNIDRLRHETKLDRHVAYIVGVDGSLKKVDLGECAHRHCYPLVCPYVPSLISAT